MRTIRGRLTVWYSVALVVALAAFCVALYLNPPEPSRQDLDHRTELDADFAVHYLEESYRVLGRLVSRDPSPSLDAGIGAAFEGLQSYVAVLGPEGEVLYLSPRARAFDFSTLEDFLKLGRPLPTAPQVGDATVGTRQLHLRTRIVPVEGAGSDIAALLVATPTNATPLDPNSLLGAILLAAPVLLAASLLLGYWLAGTVARPVQAIMEELEAITDGRTLHRRVMVPASRDEMARLGNAVNNMLARLEQSFTSLHRFTADASHELKTPLMVLRAGVERSLTHPSTPPEILQTLDETLEQINWMSEMVESLLTLARADEGRAPLSLERCDLRGILEDIVETAGMLGEQHAVAVTADLPPAPVVVAIDPHRIRELLLNLVTNAIKYTPSGGQVSIGLAENSESVAMVVRDTGIGIAPGDLPHIFDRFWRADPARSRTGDRPGTGLGLAITKWIAEAHGGTIAVQSRPGRGTSVTVTLPKAALPEETASPAAG